MTPFYKKALSLFTKTQENQIQKGLAKYPEPFTPSHWTTEELLNHALEETVDLTHYLVGLKELLDAKDKEIESLKNRLHASERLTQFRMDKNGNLTRVTEYDLNFNPHFDQDDQH